MQVSIHGDKAKIKLTKSERRKLVDAVSILRGIEKFEENHVAADELELLLKRIDSETGEFTPKEWVCETDPFEDG